MIRQKLSSLGSLCSTMFEGMTRIKPLDEGPIVDSNLKRCLGVPDLTLLGVGGMVGSGVYVLVGVGARDQAGPAIIVSFLLAAVITFLIAACFTEFACQVKRTGSTYQYMYITIGEMAAFMMGFFRLLTTIAAGATNGRAWSAYLDYLTDNAISNATKTYLPTIEGYELVSEYPDFVAGAIILLLTVVSCIGVQCSSKFNMVFAVVNISVLLFASITAFCFADITNWTSNSTGGPGAGDGGFLPYGWSGVLEGTGVCFWAFIGWDIIVLSAEETKEPQRTIPMAMAICITGVAFLYISVAAALTMMTPYSTLDFIAPLPSAFAATGLPWAKYIVSFGPLCGLTTTLLSCIFIFIRMTYAMAEDGLIFGLFAKINNCTKVPVFSCLLGGCIMIPISMFMNIKSIISFTVLITLLQFVVVDACVIILRYKPDSQKKFGILTESETEAGEKKCLISKQNSGAKSKMVTFRNPDGEIDSEVDVELDSDSDETSQVIFNLGEIGNEYDAGKLKPGIRKALKLLKCGPGSCVPVSVLNILIISFLLILLIFYDMNEVASAQWSILMLLGLMSLLIILLFIGIMAHNQTNKAIPVKVPFLPLTPYLSILSCLVLMVATGDIISWTGVGIATVLGSGFYMTYGAFHSKLRNASVPYSPLVSKQP